MLSLPPGWRTSWTSTPARTTPRFRWCAWTRSLTSSWLMPERRSRPPQDATTEKTPSMCAMGRARSSAGSSRWPAGVGSRPADNAPKSTGPTKSSDYSPSTIPTPPGSCWSWTTSTPTASDRSTRQGGPAFTPATAFALAHRLEIHHTPKHGSWLNIAEIELSALTRQCLDRRIDDPDVLNGELAAWQTAVNADQRQVNWHFTAQDARTKLRHLYPNR